MNKYLDYISDEHLFDCIRSLHTAYLKAKSEFTKSRLYSNKVDIFKFIFDTKFNNLSESELVENEILRQIDKSINNSIGTFHEQILGGIIGYSQGNLSGFDIKADDDSLFADIKNKHNTMNSSSAEALFQKLARYADDYKHANCYWVQILAKKSFCEHWKGEINGKEYSHSRVFKISGDQFYALLTKRENALFELYKVLPSALSDYLRFHSVTASENIKTAFDEIKMDSQLTDRSQLDQISYENFGYYIGFDEL